MWRPLYRWMVGENPSMMTGGSPISGNPHISLYYGGELMLSHYGPIAWTHQRSIVPDPDPSCP